MTVKGGMDAWPLLNPKQSSNALASPRSNTWTLQPCAVIPSDGLPGVPGIGDKTAVRLIQQFGDLAGVQRACGEEPLIKPLTPRLAGLINDHADYLQTAKAVSAIRRDVPVPDAATLLRLPIPTFTRRTGSLGKDGRRLGRSTIRRDSDERTQLVPIQEIHRDLRRDSNELLQHRRVADDSSVDGRGGAVGNILEGWIGGGLLDLSQYVDYLSGPTHEVPSAHIVAGEDGQQ